MIQKKAQSGVNGMYFTRAATPYWIIRVAPFARVVKRSSAVLRLLARTRHYRRDAPSGQPLHNSLNPSNLPCWTTSVYGLDGGIHANDLHRICAAAHAAQVALGKDHEVALFNEFIR